MTAGIDALIARWREKAAHHLALADANAQKNPIFSADCYVTADIARDYADELQAALDALGPAPRRPLHAECHDLVCNSSREHPRGTVGVSCSCRGRDTAYAELEELRGTIASRRKRGSLTRKR